jgi:hypothetical protein
MNLEPLSFSGISHTLRKFASDFWARLKKRGPKFLVVALLANPIGMGCGYGIYKHFSGSIGIAATSLISGILHAALTYSSHYFFTFGRPGSYLPGLAKMYAGAWVGMLITSAISQILLGTLQIPFFWVQFIMLVFGASYSVCVNFLFVYRERPEH